jgi:hypothetical protein
MSAMHTEVAKNHMWFDSGASHHVASDDKWLHDIVNLNSDIGFVELGGGERQEVASEGEVIFENGVRLEKVLFVPSLEINLCSRVIISDKGAQAVLNWTYMSVYVEGEKVLSGMKEKSYSVLKNNCTIRLHLLLKQRGKLLVHCLLE